MDDATKLSPFLTFKVKKLIDADTLKKDLAYSASDLTSAMMDQASMFAHYGVLAADASRQVDNFKFLLEQAEAAVYRKVRDAAVANGEKVTEVLLDKQVSRNPKIIALKKALNEAKQIESVGKTAVESFRHRRDMLVQHGLISREEMKGELSIAAKRIHEEELEHTTKRFLASRQNNDA